MPPSLSSIVTVVSSTISLCYLVVVYSVCGQCPVFWKILFIVLKVIKLIRTCEAVTQKQSTRRKLLMDLVYHTFMIEHIERTKNCDMKFFVLPVLPVPEL